MVVFPTATIETLPLLELIVADEVFELANVLVPLLSVVKVFVMESPVSYTHLRAHETQ